MEKLIQLQTEQVLLTYLLAVSMNDNASFQTKAVTLKALNELKTYIQVQQKISKDTDQTAHLALCAGAYESSYKAKPTVHKNSARCPNRVRC